MMKRFRILFVLAMLASPAWAGSFTPLTSVSPTTATYTDQAPADGASYTYIVTEYGPTCPAQPVCGESVFTDQFTVTIPATGTHTVSLTWTPTGQAGVTGQNVYRFPSPAATSNLSATVN